MTRAVRTQLKNAFGFDPAESAHHFVILVPRPATEQVTVSEHYTWDEVTGSRAPDLSPRSDGQIRVFLPRPKWDIIADELRAHFNQRLKRLGHRPGSWQSGPNLLRRDLGKELLLLAWAIEDADPALIPVAIANWLGLEPEERWWLYTMTAASTGHALNDRGKGWRRAVRYALTENPTVPHAASEARVPEFFARAAGPIFKGPDWGDEDDE